jgi:hypothetical protein
MLALLSVPRCGMVAVEKAMSFDEMDSFTPRSAIQTATR